MADRTVKVTLRAEVNQYKQAMDGAARATDQVGSAATKTSKQAESSFGRMLQSAQQNREAWTVAGGAMTVAGGAILGVGAAALRTGIQYNTMQQTTRAALTTLLGSAEAANAQMDKLDAFAKTSPFAKQTFIQAQQQMLAFGIETQKVIPYLDAVQDAVAAAGGSNADIEAIVATMSKIQSSAKVTAEDLNEFGNRGVNAAELIGSQMGMTGAEIRDAITSGSLDATAALDALAAGMSEQFDGAADNVKNTFAGAMDRVKAAWRDFSAELATPLVDPNGGGALVDLLNWAADAMRAFESLPGPVKTSATALAGVAGVASTLGGAFLLLAPRVADNIAQFKAFTAEHPRMAAGMGRVAKSVGVATAAFVGLQIALPILDRIFNASNKTAAGIEATTSALIGLNDANLDSLFTGLGQDFDDLGGALDLLLGSSFDSKMERLGSTINEALGGHTADQVKDASEQFTAIGDALAQMIRSGDGEMAAGIFDQLAERAVAAGYSVEQVTELLGSSYTEALATVDNEQATAAGSADGLTAGLDGVTGAAEEGTSALERHIEALNAQQEAMREASDAALGLRGAERGLESAIDAASKSVETNGATLDITTEKGRNNAKALDDIASAGLGVVDSMRENGASQRDLQGTMARTREAFIRAAESMGMSSAEAHALADELGLIPSSVKVNVSADTATAMSRLGALNSTLNSINGRTVTAAVAIRQYGQAALATGGLVGFAGGGVVPGTPPADPMQDNVLARTQHGSAYALRSGEFVQSEPAVQHYGVGFMHAINQKRIPKDVLTGFAVGGQVPGSSVRTMTGSVSAIQSAGPRIVQYITNNYPQAEPTSVTTNRGLQYAAAIGTTP